MNNLTMLKWMGKKTTNLNMFEQLDQTILFRYCKAKSQKNCT